MLFENKKNRYKVLLLFIIPLITLLLVFIFLTYSSVISLTGNKTLSSGSENDIEKYDYHLRSNATEYQKELFKELNKLIKDKTDDLEIVESVVKNYVADAYTWDNKQGQWDVGGMWFVHSPSKYHIYQNQKDNFYCFLDKYQEEYGKTGLLEVSNVEITFSEISSHLYEYDGETFEHYNVECRIEFSESSRFANQIADYLYLDVIKNNDGRYEITDCHGNEY